MDRPLTKFPSEPYRLSVSGWWWLLAQLHAPRSSPAQDVTAPSLLLMEDSRPGSVEQS